ncbi:MAG: DNA polymerase III subunit delta', partial [Candidatus Edwardsbacteria bacterium]|nr:DNA polymerase III subunit delta' [Candidatus Edwardsbacteria bacterium]
MLFNDLIGQEVAKKLLASALAENRLAQSLLFYGPDGVGKELAAVELARAINCQADGVDFDRLSLTAQDKPCGACNSCKRIASFQHPDFIYLFPVPHPSAESDKRKLTEEIGEFLKEKSEKSYLQPRFDKAVSIAIDDIRELQAKMALRPYEGARKVALIANAEAMTAEAASAFLKTLEEPSPTTHFILITDRPNFLLPTIVSRCQKLRFNHLSERQIEQALRERHGAEPAAAKLLAELSGGSLGKALEMMNQDLLDDRDRAWRIVMAASQKRYCEMLAAVDEIAREKGKPERVLGFISALAADLLKYRLQGAVAHADKKKEIEILGKLYTPDDLGRLVKNIERYTGNRIEVHT